MHLRYDRPFNGVVFVVALAFVALFVSLAPMRAAMDGAHALHVIGGLVPMAIVAARAAAGRYGPGRCAGVVYVAMYWHFLDGVWVVLFLTLLLGTR